MPVFKARLYGLIIGINLIFVMIGCGAKADVPQDGKGEWEKLSRLAEEIYGLAADGRAAEAKQKLMMLEKEMLNVHGGGASTVEGWHAITDAMLEAKRRFQAVGYDSEAASSAVARLRLAADAAAHPQQPIWLQYHRLLKADLQQVHAALQGNNGKEAKAAYSRLRQRVDLIRPAVRVSRSPSESEKLDSLLAHIETQLTNPRADLGTIDTAAKQLDEAIDGIFRMKDDKTAYLPIGGKDRPIAWTLGIGSLILAVLAFAAWRMIRSDRFKKA